MDVHCVVRGAGWQCHDALRVLVASAAFTQSTYCSALAGAVAMPVDTTAYPEDTRAYSEDTRVYSEGHGSSF